MRKVYFLFAIAMFFGTSFAQLGYLGSSKSELLSSEEGSLFQNETTETGIEYLSIVNDEFGATLLFFDYDDICRALLVYPKNDDLRDELVDFLSQNAEKEAGQEWTTEDDAGNPVRIALLTDTDGTDYFQITYDE